VEHIVPQHCTGIEAIGAVMQRLPRRFTPSSVGTTFEFAAP
jgi:metal-dependent hydrolase (beta-lactamase superfamily II)